MNAEALDQATTYIRSWLKFRYEHENLPGFAVAISHEGNVLLDEAYGYANLRKRTELNTRHVFRIASQAKTFTATALMQLQEAGKLRIDDRVTQHLPWLKEHKDERFKEVTIRQLLSHGAGVIRDGTDAGYWSFEQPFPDEEALKAEMLKTGLIIEANTQFKYSNCGYALLGLIIEAASGQTYNEYTIEHITQPLGLTSTGPDYDASVRDRFATGYTRRNANKKRKPHPVNVDTGAMSPALGFYSTASDLCAFYAAQILGSQKLLGDESKKEMQRSQWHIADPEMDFGLGLDLVTLCEHKMIGFSGGFPGHVSRTLADADNQIVVAALVNAENGPAEAIAENIHRIISYFQENMPARPQSAQYRLDHLAGRYASIFDIIDVIVTGEKVIVANPEHWNPLAGHEELMVHRGAAREITLRIRIANPTAAPGELVHFFLKRGKVETVRYAGITMYPEATWNKMQ